jgi:hypothetical protein
MRAPCDEMAVVGAACTLICYSLLLLMHRIRDPGAPSLSALLTDVL